MNEKEEDYKSLIGKTVRYIYEREMIDITGIVINIDQEIGLTIVNEDNPDHYLVCLNGTKSPKRKLFTIQSLQLYKELFNYIVKAIPEGIIDVEKLKAINTQNYLSNFGMPDSSTCAFSKT